MSWLHWDVCLSADLLPDQGQVQLGRQVVIWNLKVGVRWVLLKTQWFASVQRNNELEWKPRDCLLWVCWQNGAQKDEC